MIGLSISQCTEDVVSGNTDINDVARIVGRTRIETIQSLNEVIKWYRDCHWFGNPNMDQCEKIMRRLFSEGKIIQPRSLTHDDKCVPFIEKNRVIWVKNESEIIWRADIPANLASIPLLDWPTTTIIS